MRDLKFRAWNGKYMSHAEYGDWISFDGVPYTEASKHYNTPNIEIEKAKNYVLMQCTGLLDKNGKLIYEGDIVKLAGGLSGIVQWKNELALYEIIINYWEQPHTVTLYSAQEDGKNINREVIGNKFENTDLLTPL